MTNDMTTQPTPFLVNNMEVKPFQSVEVTLTSTGYDIIVKSLMARSPKITYGNVLMHIEANWERGDGTFRFPLTKFQEFFGPGVTEQSALDNDLVSSITSVPLLPTEYRTY